MFKKMIKSAIVGAGLLGMVGAAQAATIDINIYGASAQYLFWNDAADDFLTARGCTGVEQAQDADKKNGITKGTCSGDTVYIRYSSKASYDGVYASKGQEMPAAVGGQPSCKTGDTTPAGPKGPKYRAMADEGQTNFTSKVVSGLKCVEVNLGASDVAGDTFGQYSSGGVKGCGTTPSVTRDIQSIDTTGMTTYQPVIVPFGFFANQAVNTTTAGAPISPAPVTNLSRLEALMIYSGAAWKWSDFGGTRPNKWIVACLRHAGSGTHSTLDAAVMRGDWGLAGNEKCGTTHRMSFNDGSSDLMKCVNLNDGQNTNTHAAIGYSDADQAEAIGAGKTYPNVIAINYEGAAPTRVNIQNGVYSFWSAQWIYESNPGNTTLHPWVEDLMAFASTTLPATKANWWSTAAEMNVTKANDFAMPTF